MEWLDKLLHLDRFIPELVSKYGSWIYLMVTAAVFLESALPIFPFIPGDSLLFALGMVSANPANGLSPTLLFFLLTGAGIIGGVVNFYVGKSFGEKMFESRRFKVFSPENLKKTHDFFERRGAATIVVARFIPVIRGFAPFVAGMGAMTFRNFMVYNVLGAVLWVGVCMAAGFFLGQIPIVRERFELAILGLVVLSVTPIIIEMILHKRAAKKEAQGSNDS